MDITKVALQSVRSTGKVVSITIDTRLPLRKMEGKSIFCCCCLDEKLLLTRSPLMPSHASTNFDILLKSSNFAMCCMVNANDKCYIGKGICFFFFVKSYYGNFLCIQELRIYILSVS